MKKSVRLEQWLLLRPEGTTASFLRGFVYGHPNVADGLSIRTSSILRMDAYTAETENTVYLLGEKLYQDVVVQPLPMAQAQSAFMQ